MTLGAGTLIQRAAVRKIIRHTDTRGEQLLIFLDLLKLCLRRRPAHAPNLVELRVDLLLPERAQLPHGIGRQFIGFHRADRYGRHQLLGVTHARGQRGQGIAPTGGVQRGINL